MDSNLLAASQLARTIFRLDHNSASRHEDLPRSNSFYRRGVTGSLEMSDLLRALDEDFDNLANWHPLADWLIERDDPRGELINIDLALEAGTGDREPLAERR